MKIRVIRNQFCGNIVTVAVWLLLMPCMACAGQNSALFESGQDIDILRTNAGPAGAMYQVEGTGLPIDGATVEIPEGALREMSTVRLYYNTGKFKPVSGESSGVVFGISAGNLKQFQQFLKISVRYDPKRYKGSAVVGFSIDPDGSGRVSGFQMISQDTTNGIATFVTLVPVRFTWIYVPMTIK